MAAFFQEQIKGDEHEGEPLICSSPPSVDLLTIYDRHLVPQEKNIKQDHDEIISVFLCLISSQTCFFSTALSILAIVPESRISEKKAQVSLFMDPNVLGFGHLIHLQMRL